MAFKTGLIEGKLVTLQSLKEEFFEEYHHMFSSTVRQAIGLSPVGELQDTVVFLTAAMSDPQHLMFYCVFDNKTNTLIGSVVVRCQGHQNGQLGAWLNEKFWGEGRYQDALFLVLKEYFKSETNDSISALIEISNKRSLRAHQKMGFVVVGDDHVNGKYRIVLTRVAFKENGVR